MSDGKTPLRDEMMMRQVCQPAEGKSPKLPYFVKLSGTNDELGTNFRNHPRAVRKCGTCVTFDNFEREPELRASSL